MYLLISFLIFKESVELNKCLGTTVFTEILFLKYFLLDFYCLLHHLMFIEVELRYNHNYRSDLYYALFFPIVTLPFLRCNISTTHVYEVNISSYVSYQVYLVRGLLLSSKLLSYRFLVTIMFSHHFKCFTDAII